MRPPKKNITQYILTIHLTHDAREHYALNSHGAFHVGPARILRTWFSQCAGSGVFRALSRVSSLSSRALGPSSPRPREHYAVDSHDGSAGRTRGEMARLRCGRNPLGRGRRGLGGAAAGRGGGRAENALPDRHAKPSARPGRSVSPRLPPSPHGGGTEGRAGTLRT